MQRFQCLLFVLKRSYICYIISMTVPLTRHFSYVKVVPWLIWSVYFWSLFGIANECMTLPDCRWNFMSITLVMFRLSLLIIYLLFKCVLSSHFRGATISWKPSDKEGEVGTKFQKQMLFYAPIRITVLKLQKICPKGNFLLLLSGTPESQTWYGMSNMIEFFCEIS